MSFLVFIFVAAAMVWALILMPRLSLPLLGFAVLIIGTAFGPYFFAIEGPLAISIDRILWAFMMGLFVLSCLLGRTMPIQFGRLDWLVFVFIGWLFVSSQMGDAPPSGSPPLARWIFYAMMPLGAYIVARFSRITKRDLRFIEAGLILLGAYLSLTAVAETRGLSALVFPSYISDPTQVEFLGRGRGPLLNPTGNGILLVLCLTATFLHLRQAKSRVAKLWLSVAVAVNLGGVFATLTRSVWMSAVGALGLLEFPRLQRRVRVWCVAVAMFGLLGLSFGLGDQILNMKRDKHLSASAAKESIELRPLLAIIAFEMFKDQPMTGFGYGHYFAYNEEYTLEPSWGMPLRKAARYMQHNVLLSYLVDTGLIGAGMFLMLFAAWGFHAWQIGKNPSSDEEVSNMGLIVLSGLFAYLFNGMFQDVSIIPMANMYLFFFVGLLMSIEHAEGNIPESSPIAKLQAGSVALPSRRREPSC